MKRRGGKRNLGEVYKCILDYLNMYSDHEKFIERKKILYILKCLFHTGVNSEKILNELVEYGYLEIVEHKRAIYKVLG